MREALARSPQIRPRVRNPQAINFPHYVILSAAKDQPRAKGFLFPSSLTFTATSFGG
jgi:hypothetical protein